MIEIAAKLEDPKVWDDPKAAQELGREKKQLEAVVEQVNDVTGRLRDAEELFGLAREENDDDTLQSVEADVHGVDKSVAEMEFRRMFSNPLDPNNCFLDIQAGSGGTEAQDPVGPPDKIGLLPAQGGSGQGGLIGRILR